MSGAKHNPVCATLLKRMRIAAFFTNGKKPVQVTPFPRRHYGNFIAGEKAFERVTNDDAQTLHAPFPDGFPFSVNYA